MRIIFANQLRGFAALLVLISHFLGVFFDMQPIVSSATLTPDMQLQTPWWTNYVLFTQVNYGPFGVAIFFLISGFVISFSLTRYTPRVFIIGRILRIFPTYWVCLLLSLFCLYVNSLYWDIPFIHSYQSIVANFFLVHNLFGYTSIDLVNWTLSIEIKFYLLMALIGTKIISAGFKNILLFCLYTTMFTIVAPLLLQHPELIKYQHVISTLVVEINVLLFMLIGSFFYLHITNRITTSDLIIRSTFLLLIFSVNWALNPLKNQFFLVTQNYYFGLIIFAVFYGLRGYFKPNMIMDFFANISYPLYLIHSLIGYSLLKFLLHMQISFKFCLVIVSIFVFVLAYVVHIMIEKPSIRLFKKYAIL